MTEPEHRWAPPAVAPPHPLAGLALWLAIAGLGVSLVVGWGFPIAVAALLVGVVAVRRPGDRHGMALWAIGLASLALLYSVGWLAWAATRL